jgi:hypothetical protein
VVKSRHLWLKFANPELQVWGGGPRESVRAGGKGSVRGEGKGLSLGEGERDLFLGEGKK